MFKMLCIIIEWLRVHRILSYMLSLIKYRIIKIKSIKNTDKIVKRVKKLKDNLFITW